VLHYSLIGGIPTIFYIEFGSKGRGEVIRLFCEDAGIAYRDHRLCVLMLGFLQWLLLGSFSSLEEFNSMDPGERKMYR
jgi:hypothetical protein